MPTSPLFGGAGLVSRRSSTVTEAQNSYLDQIQKRLNNMPTLTGIKPSQTRSVIPQSQQVSSPRVTDLQQDVNSQARGYSQRTTGYVQQAAQKQQQRLEEQKKREEEAQRQQELLAQQQQSISVPQQQQGNVQLVSNQVQGLQPGSQRATVVNAALSLIGTPYAWGGGGYGNKGSRGVGKGTQNVIGVDCSGLTSYALSTIGLRVARQSDQQLRTSGYKTSINNLQPGDLVGWARGGHVAMYIGNGMIVESPNVGKTVRTRKIYPGEAVFGVHLNLS